MSASTDTLLDSSKASRTAKAWAAESAESSLAPFSIQRREPLADDVVIDILYCGVCHSDLHQARNEWHNSVYPVVPGHEIVGRVVKAGRGVTKFKEGDLAAVGCMVDSCRVCASCRRGLEQYCEKFPTFTYNGIDKHLGGMTFGGYSESIVVDQAYVLRVSEKAEPRRHRSAFVRRHHHLFAACAIGMSGPAKRSASSALEVSATWASNSLTPSEPMSSCSPLHPVKPTTRSASAPMKSSSRKTPNEMQKHANSFHFILDAVSADHDINAYISLLKLDGTLTLVGAPEAPLPVSAFNLLLGRRSFAGSGIGGIAETQEMLDFCAEHNIVSEIEMIGIQQVNEAYSRLLKNDVKYRFVIDMASLKR